MKLELEERGNIHTDTVWFEIIDSQAPFNDEGNIVATIEGRTQIHYQLGRIFAAAPDLLVACQKQQIALEKLLAICSPKTVGVHFLNGIIYDACTCAAEAIAKAHSKI